jgi:hypothetical protein
MILWIDCLLEFNLKHFYSSKETVRNSTEDRVTEAGEKWFSRKGEYQSCGELLRQACIIFFSDISPDRTNVMLRTSVQSYWILEFLIPLLFHCQADCNLLLKRGTRLFSQPPSFNLRTSQFYMVAIMCVCFLHITIKCAFFRRHSEYNRNALKKQYATFTTLTSPTLKVTFHHPSPLFWEHELQQTYVSHGWSVNKQNNIRSDHFSKAVPLESSYPRRWADNRRAAV